MSGRYVWVCETEYIEGVKVEDVRPVWRQDEEPKCARCSDYGSWIGESNDVEPCPDCAGAA